MGLKTSKTYLNIKYLICTKIFQPIFRIEFCDWTFFVLYDLHLVPSSDAIQSHQSLVPVNHDSVTGHIFLPSMYNCKLLLLTGPPDRRTFKKELTAI